MQDATQRIKPGSMICLLPPLARLYLRISPVSKNAYTCSRGTERPDCPEMLEDLDLHHDPKTLPGRCSPASFENSARRPSALCFQGQCAEQPSSSYQCCLASKVKRWLTDPSLPAESHTQGLPRLRSLRSRACLEPFGMAPVSVSFSSVSASAGRAPCR